ncbi:LysR family transcriptional regulator [Pseudogracilibacillus sp. SE30717A]|uniref:LysR family transcriptional regulator n=1 Tax=Pseudogracilibacillus sp. SE30717A TaxID=3098293 RepID=UPI00300E62AB
MDQYLKVFITVVERQNFSRAAEELLMTQPAVSQYIRTFEENIGARLLERTSKYVRLTKAGEIVYHHGTEIVGLYTRMQTLVEDLINYASGPLSIGASFTFGEYVLPHIIAKMQENNPAIQPTVTIGNTKEIVNYMTRHQLDVGIIEGKFNNDPHMHVEDFAEDYMVVIASPKHPLVNRKEPINIPELNQEKWVLREIGSGTREAADTVFERHKIIPNVAMSFGSTQAIKEAVGAGLGISLLSRWAIQRELQNGDLRILDVEGLPFARKFSIVTTSPFQTKAQQVFIELLHSSKEITDMNF